MNRLNLDKSTTKLKDTFFDPSETVTLFNFGENSQKIDRLRLIYNEEPLAISSYLVIIFIMMVMAWPLAEQHLLFAGFITNALILSIRFILNLSFKSKINKNIHPDKWQHRFIILNIISGITIGSIGMISLASDSYLLPIILTVGLISITSISSATLSSEKNIFICFMLPNLLPLTLNTLISNDSIHNSISILIVIFSITTLLLSTHIRQNIDKNFKLNSDKSHLFEDLIASNQRLEKENKELEQLVTEDYLTGLANRRYGDLHLQTEWKKAIRFKRAISIIMIDIDKFKPFNDQYGHQLGDDCLQITAAALKQTLSRPADLAVRYGGEEFIIILPDTDAAGAYSIAERFRSVLNKIHIPHLYSDVTDHITASCGIASTVPNRINTFKSLVNRADIAMYKAKFSGGNQTTIFK